MSEAVLFDLKSETALIGSVAINPDLIPMLTIEADDLWLATNRDIYRAMRALYDDGQEVDIVTIQAHDPSISITHLLEAIDQTPTSANWHSYERRIQDLAARRRIIENATGLVAAAMDTSAPLDDAVSNAIDRLSRSTAPNKAAMSASDLVRRVQDTVQARMDNPTDVWGIPTGLDGVDLMIGGLTGGQVLFIGGEPGLGKSKLVGQIILSMAHAGYPGVLFSCEMPAEDVMVRMVSLAGRVPTRDMLTGDLTGANLQAYKQAATEVSDLPVYINDSPGITIAQIRSELTRMKAKHGISWFAIDYLMLLGGYDNLGDTERSQALSKGIKQIARELDIPGIVISSITKEAMGDGARYSSKMLRGSLQVAHDADFIAFMVKDENQPNMIRLVFVKARSVAGGGRTVYLEASSQYPGFTEIQQVSLNEATQW